MKEKFKAWVAQLRRKPVKQACHSMWGRQCGRRGSVVVRFENGPIGLRLLVNQERQR